MKSPERPGGARHADPPTLTDPHAGGHAGAEGRRGGGGSGQGGASLRFTGTPSQGASLLQRQQTEDPGPLATRRPPAALRASGWDRRAPWDPWTAATHVGVPISKDLVEDMAELPAEDGAAGKRQADGVGPEGEGPLFMVSAQNDASQRQGQVRETETHVESRPLTPQPRDPPPHSPAPPHLPRVTRSYGSQPRARGRARSCPSNVTGASGLRRQAVFPRRDSESDPSTGRREGRQPRATGARTHGASRLGEGGPRGAPVATCSTTLPP